MRRTNFFIACSVICLIPGLMLLHQFLMPRGKGVVPPGVKLNCDAALFQMTENAFVYGQENAAAVAMAAGLYVRKGMLHEAEKLCRLGVYEYRHPPIMVFYGDLLAGQKRFKEALRWYDLALKLAREKGEKSFVRFVEAKRKVLVSGGAAR